MSSRRAQSLPPHMMEPKPTRGRCVTAICFSWKVITCIVSHVTLVLLVVSYCVGGAYLFQHLEKQHEIDVKQDIRYMRLNLTDKIWKFSDNATVLSENDWIANVKKDLANFEKNILTAMKTDGWDGDENINKTQWTFAGSLFYSIIVITTIGYGHISPRTDWGKVTTIFYAIVGIPLMLLCLSNIGDVMATSFRFIYWRVCCYVCTRTAKRPRHRSHQRSIRPQRYSSRSQPPAFRRSMRLTQRSSNNSGVGPPIGLSHAHSDPELRTVGRSDYERDIDYGGIGRYYQQMPPSHQSSRHTHTYEDDRYNEGNPNYTQTLNRGSRFSGRQRNRHRMHDRHTVEREHYLSRSKQYLDTIDNFNTLPPPAKRTLSVRSVRTPNPRREDASRVLRESREPQRSNTLALSRGRSMSKNPRRAKSVDPRASAIRCEDLDEEIIRKTPIISNRYAIDELDYRENHPKSMPRSQSMPRAAHHQNRYSSQEPHNGVVDSQSYLRRQFPHSKQQRRSSLSRQQPSQHSRFGNRLELPEFTSPHMNQSKHGRSPRSGDYEEEFDDCYLEDNDIEGVFDDYPIQQSRHRERKQRRERPERLPPSPRIMSPMGFAVKRQIRRRPSYDYENDSAYGDEGSDYYGDISPKDRPVPIWLCVFLVISYILGGASLFAYWEQWSYLDSAYFCFITLTTIGFGDFVPAKGVKDESEQSIAYCSLYLLFGIALLAMSFNLVQEEFIANVKEVARRLGILKDEEEYD